MGSLNEYRQLIKDQLTEYANLENRGGADMIKADLVFDDERDHYMLFRTGWWDKRRIHAAALYVRLKDGKIWIEEDMTEDGLATDLLAAGVPKEDIVLAFHHPHLRPYTEFAAA